MTFPCGTIDGIATMRDLNSDVWSGLLYRFNE